MVPLQAVPLDSQGQANQPLWDSFPHPQDGTNHNSDATVDLEELDGTAYETWGIQ